jgi:hypothetical protein
MCRALAAYLGPGPCADLQLCATGLPMTEAGRGLALLDALTLRSGVEQGVGAKTVWCELREESPAARPLVGTSGALAAVHGRCPSA